MLLAALPLVASHPGETEGDGALDERDHHQHGGASGHLAASSLNVELVGRLDLTNFEGRIADVTVFGHHAYLAGFDGGDCKRGGVHVVDVSDPANPARVGFIPAGQGTYVGEGVHVIRIDTPQFTGDVLVHNNEICGVEKPNTHGGVTLVDVTDPLNPVWLARGVGDRTNADGSVDAVAHEVHSAFLWQRGDKAYAVLVDNEEAADVDVLDVSDPRNPVLVAEHDLNGFGILQPDVHGQASFLHDMVVKEIGGHHVMLLSYWDGGYVRLLVDDPANPVFLDDTDFASADPERMARGHEITPEGNAHQAEFSHDNAFFLATDEDFDPYRLVAENADDGTSFSALQGSDVPQVAGDRTLAGRTVFVGRACNGDAAVPAASGDATIAVVERGLCTFTEKVANVEAAGGWAGVLVMNAEGADRCTALVNMAVAGGVPTLSIGRDTGFDLFDLAYDDAACRDGSVQLAPIAVGALGDAVSIRAVFDGWGYVHLYDAAGNEVDTYAIPESQDPAYASGFGDLSVHEVATDPDENLAYFSYYAGGFRVARFGADGITEVGHYVAEGGSNLWGVEVYEHEGETYVLASDRDSGLWLFRYTGP